MRRLARRLFTLCSAVSLLLSVAVCVLWVRSFLTMEVFESIHRAGARSTWESLFSTRGTLLARVQLSEAPSPADAAAVWPSDSFYWISELEGTGHIEGHFPERFWNGFGIGFRVRQGTEDGPGRPPGELQGEGGLFGSADSEDDGAAGDVEPSEVAKDDDGDAHVHGDHIVDRDISDADEDDNGGQQEERASSAGLFGPDDMPVVAIRYCEISATLPHWLMMTVLAISPAVSLRRWYKRRRRFRSGRCATCGYDRRASPDRCPECGAAAISN